MFTASRIFKILTICGVWVPIDESNSKFYKYLYWFYTIVTLFIYHAFNLTQILYLLWGCKSSADFNEQLMYQLMVISVCLKIDNLIINRGKIVDLAKLLRDPLFVPSTETEKEICQKSVDKIR